MDRRTFLPTLRRADHRLARDTGPTLGAIEREKSTDNVRPVGLKHGRRPGVPSGPAWRGTRQRKAGEQMGKVHGNCRFVFRFESVGGLDAGESVFEGALTGGAAS